MTLTPRETEVYRLLMSGKSGVECAKELGIDLGTFKHHAHWVYLKHGVSGRLQLIAKEHEPNRSNA